MTPLLFNAGYRNIQNQISSLMFSKHPISDKLPNGMYKDIRTIQKWLESAWEAGFDSVGAEQLGKQVHGTTKWIGATEAASIFRYFGIAAFIADFGVDIPASEMQPSKNHASNMGNSSKGGNDGTVAARRQVETNNSERANYTTQTLMIWILRYFSRYSKQNLADQTKFIELSEKQMQIHLTDKYPLYLQHDGHSTTVIGIECNETMDGKNLELFLYVLDPGISSEVLQDSMLTGNGWQRFMKYGLDDLLHKQFQVMWIDHSMHLRQPGSNEYEGLKTIKASERYS